MNTHTTTVLFLIHRWENNSGKVEYLVLDSLLDLEADRN